MNKNKNLKPKRGEIRPVIDRVYPELSAGRYAVKRVVGDLFRVETTIVLDGHDLLCAQLLYRHNLDKTWTIIPMRPKQHGKDLWEASFELKKPGSYFYTVQTSVDRFATWRSELEKKYHAKQPIELELREGALLLKDILRRLPRIEQPKVRDAILSLNDPFASVGKKFKTVGKGDLFNLVSKYPDRALTVSYPNILRVYADREKAAFSAWYEFFPRSTSGSITRHGTFRDAEKMLPYISQMGFDVVYLPPIHPIGFAFRKGKNNSLEPSKTDPGSPWGIGSSLGGHKEIHPELGTMSDFLRFIKKAKSHKLEIALDIAFQCSPDHPYVKQHPEWFKKRPDGSIQYAENPPKKYQDIYPFNFESPSWPKLWDELKSVVEFWIKQGIRIFRVDNPHTKPTLFWEWLIREIQSKHPDVIFLSEAFTRPSMMYLLAKVGFTQSYTYFTWRNTPQEFQKYMEELTRPEVSEYYRPNFWPNTPDILPTHLQSGNKAAFKARVALAATLSSTYGIYGPAYEQCVHVPFKKGGEEYLDSEKYEIKAWDLQAKNSIKDFIGRLNEIRKTNSALHRNDSIRFLKTDNEKVVAYWKQSRDKTNNIVVLVNLDFVKTQSVAVELPLTDLGIDTGKTYTVVDLLTRFSSDAKDSKTRMRLNPSYNPVAIIRIEK